MIDWTLTWETVLSISTAVMALAIGFTAFFAVKQLSSMGRTRCSDLLMYLHETWDSREYLLSRKMIYDHSHGANLEEASKNLKEALITFDRNNAEEFFMMVRIANFFENLGFLVCKKYLDPKDAKELFGGPAKSYWGRFLAYIMYHREEREEKQPDAWIYFEYLALGCKKAPTSPKSVI